MTIRDPQIANGTKGPASRVLLEGMLTSSNTVTVTKTVPAGTYQIDSVYPLGVTIGGTYAEAVSPSAGLLTVASTQSSITLNNRCLGVVWSDTTLPANADWYDVAYGNGVWVAIANYVANAATSTDGINWTVRTTPSSSLATITFGNGIFVAVGNDAAATSTDGITWTSRTIPTGNWCTVTYGNGTFVALATSGTNAATSTNGTTWTARTIPSGYQWNSVTYGNGLFVGVTWYDNSVIVSNNNGTNWTAYNPSMDSMWSITYGNSLFVVVGDTNSNTNNVGVKTSTNGQTWTARTMPPGTWKSVVYANGTFIAISEQTYASGAAAATSFDGITWTKRTLPVSGNFKKMGYGNNQLVAIANTVPSLSSSTFNTPFSITKIPSTIY